MIEEVRIRMWREWTDDRGAYYDAEESFEAWQAEMRPYREALLSVWKTNLRMLLERHPTTVPPGALHVLYQQAETLRTLDDSESWKAPFNRMRHAVQQSDDAELRALVAELG